MPNRPIIGKATERANQALVMGGICMNHSLISAMVLDERCLLDDWFQQKTQTRNSK